MEGLFELLWTENHFLVLRIYNLCERSDGT
jgi:hypothetical protein